VVSGSETACFLTQKWPSYSEKAARLDINVNIVYQSTAMHGSLFSISSENPYKNEMTLWHVKEQIIEQDNTHKKNRRAALQ
jgi:hypothetical protein